MKQAGIKIVQTVRRRQQGWVAVDSHPYATEQATQFKNVQRFMGTTITI